MWAWRPGKIVLPIILTAGAVTASPSLGNASSKLDGAIPAVARGADTDLRIPGYSGPMGSLAVMPRRECVSEHGNPELDQTSAMSLSNQLCLCGSDDPQCQADAYAALARFNHADAFAALKAGLNLGTETNPAPSHYGHETIDAVRCAAAQGMAQSPYPHARTYLRRFEDDPSPHIRMIVLEMVVTRTPHSPADLTFLRRKTIDSDPSVAGAALQRLRSWRP